MTRRPRLDPAIINHPVDKMRAGYYSDKDFRSAREFMLADQSRAVTAPGVVIRSRARVRYADGEDASLVLDDQRLFRISGVDALPAGARTPEQALEQLRRVLARRSYAGLMRVLSPATRSAIETDLRSVVVGLEHPEGLEVLVAGDSATVQIPGGHEVKLKREGTTWHVEDFD